MNVQRTVEFVAEVYLVCSNCKGYFVKANVPLINKCRKCPTCNHYQTLKQIGFRHTRETKASIRHAAIQREHKKILQEILQCQ